MKRELDCKARFRLEEAKRLDLRRRNVFHLKKAVLQAENKNLGNRFCCFFFVIVAAVGHAGAVGKRKSFVKATKRLGNPPTKQLKSRLVTVADASL